jgi:hypothetical protein
VALQRQPGRATDLERFRIAAGTMLPAPVVRRIPLLFVWLLPMLAMLSLA